MLLFVGLGNPGEKHAANRHNIGFMVVQAIAARHRFAPWRRRFQGVATEGTIGPCPVEQANTESVFKVGNSLGYDRS